MSEPEKLHNHAMPEELPAGEVMLWQGSPEWTSMALHTFHARKVAIYFGLLLAWRFGQRLYEGAGVVDAAAYAVWIVPMAIAAVALLMLLAFLTAKSAIYTITSKRVVLRIGVALSMTVNLPFRVVEAASLKLHADGSGDIALQLQDDSKAAYAVLWPHARRWHFSRPQPSLRSIPDARHVADTLSEALAAFPAGRPMAPARAEPRRDGPMPMPGLAYPTAAE